MSPAISRYEMLVLDKSKPVEASVRPRHDAGVIPSAERTHIAPGIGNARHVPRVERPKDGEHPLMDAIRRVDSGVSKCFDRLTDLRTKLDPVRDTTLTLGCSGDENIAEHDLATTELGTIERRLRLLEEEMATLLQELRT